MRNGMILGAGDAFARSARMRRRRSFDPEAGLLLSGEVPFGTEFTTSIVLDTQGAVLAADFENLDGSGGGLICELGGQGVGTYAGFDPNGVFWLRFGDGGDRWSEATCHVSVDAGVIDGDGTLVCELTLGSPARGRVWWNGTLVGDNSVGTVNDWTGSDTGSYMVNALVVPKSMVATKVPGTSGALRYYAAQSVL